MRNHFERVENLANFVRTLQLVRDQRTFTFNFALQKLNFLLFAPFLVRTHAQVRGDCIHGVSVTIGFLSDIELDEIQTEALHLTNNVEQIAIGDLFVAAFHQRLVAMHQRAR